MPAPPDALPAATLADTNDSRAAEAGPLPAYRAHIAAGALSADPAQHYVAEALQGLWHQLRGYDPRPEAEAPPGLFARLFGRKAPEEPPDGTPQGLYIVGEVGRGKSMLMDLFFSCAVVPRKRRLHFHQFMQQVHRRIHAWKQAQGDAVLARASHDLLARSSHDTNDPIPPLADSLAADAALLCFDEFQVHDIADAMILGRLFEALFARGVVVVTTSNTEPDDLFKGRPGRDAFLPFISQIKRRLQVLRLDAARDYRRERIRGLPTWHVPADARAERALDAAFHELTGVDHGQPLRLAVLGRWLEVPQAARGVARFDFAALCGQPLGPPDFLAIATQMHSVVIDGIPRLGPENFDRARRFVILVDALYEHRCKLVASAEAAPDALYERGDGAAIFERTASRLIEMQSPAYLALPHLT